MRFEVQGQRLVADLAVEFAVPPHPCNHLFSAGCTGVACRGSISNVDIKNTGSAGLAGFTNRAFV